MLDEETEDPARQFGFIYQDLLTVNRLLNKVIDYFNSK